MKRLFILVALSISLTGIGLSMAQNRETDFFAMKSDTAPLVPMTQVEVDQLQDPFFQLVLKKRPGVTKISDIEALLQPQVNKIRTFVVDEHIRDARRGQGRRVVIAFIGSNQETPLDGNVMLSVGLDSEQFDDDPGFIEAWGWDEKQSVYNYYRLDKARTEQATWKFRGSSKLADTLSPQDRQNTCFACHINGGPIMKEFLFPWNNWHSFEDRTSYLDGTSDTPWPVSKDPKVKGRLSSAELLEGTLISSLKRFNKRRVDELVQQNTVMDAKRLLRPLFVTTEFNLISSRQKSGIHPLDKQMNAPTANVEVPDSFFLNTHIIHSDTIIGTKGLALPDSLTFTSLVKVKPEEYKALVEESGIQLFNTKPGDSRFAWLVPEPAVVDILMVDELLKRGVITPEFVAAVMAIDLENPMFSSKRESLFAFIPDTYQVSAGQKPDALTTAVIANIKSGMPEPGSTADEFLKLLQNNDSKTELTSRITAYKERVLTRLNDPNSRKQELTRLYGLAVQRRLAVLNHPILRRLDETGGIGLLPVP